MANLDKLSTEDLIAEQQKVMAEREATDEKYQKQLAEIQYQLDLRDATDRFGVLSDAEKEALLKLAGRE